MLDFGKDPGGRLFIASELCEGQPLDRLVAATGPLPLDRAKAIVAQIGEALLEGQKVGVVHHDLSPKNVLIGGNDEVKVINFVAPLAVSETIFGVPEYLAPEQAEGKLVDQRSNTYSLGGIMVLLLSGQPPVSGADTAAVLDQVLKGEVVPPSRRLDGASTLTAEIDRVVLKAMDKSPNRRPLTMRQFLTEVSGMVARGAAPAAAGAGRRVREDDAVLGRVARGPEAGPAGGRRPRRRHGRGAGARCRGDTGSGGHAAGRIRRAAGRGRCGRRPHRRAAPHARRRDRRDGGFAARRQDPGPGHADAGREHGRIGTVHAAAGLGHAGAGRRHAAAARVSGPRRRPSRPREATSARRCGSRRATSIRWSPTRARASRRRAPRASRSPRLTRRRPPAPSSRPSRRRAPSRSTSAYVDDGSLTADDRKKFSLRSGATSTALPTVGGAVPGERMSDAEVMGEIGGKKKIIIIVIAAVVLRAPRHRGRQEADREGRRQERRGPDADDDPDHRARAPPAPPAPPDAAPPQPQRSPPRPQRRMADEPAAKPAHAPAAAKKQHAAKKAKGKKAHK